MAEQRSGTIDGSAGEGDSRASAPDTLPGTLRGASTAVEPAAPRACLNCGAELGGAFCSRCGQAAKTGRLRFPRLLGDFAHGLLELDSKVVRTCVALFTRPGRFIRDYLLGRRVGYSGPLAYFLLVVALNVGAEALLGHLGPAPAGPDAGGSSRDDFVALQLSLAFGLLLLPVAGARRLLHESAGYSLAEHYAMLLYSLAQSIVPLLLLKLALRPFGLEPGGDTEGVVWLLVFTAHVLWASRTLFADPPWRTTLKLAAAYVLMLVAAGVVGALLLPVIGR